MCGSINCVKVKMLYLFCLKYLCCLCFLLLHDLPLFSSNVYFFWWIFRFISGWGCRNCYMNNFALKYETHYTWKILLKTLAKLFLFILVKVSYLSSVFWFYSRNEIWSSAVASLTQLFESLNRTPIANECIMLPHTIRTQYSDTKATLIGTETNSLQIFSNTYQEKGRKMRRKENSSLLFIHWGFYNLQFPSII